MKKSFSGKGVFPWQWAFTLLFSFRNIFLSPSQLLKRLELDANQTVLELGPGPGYFSTHVASALKNGKLFLADIQQEMLDYARTRLEKRKLSNVEYYLCDGLGFNFADESFDRIFMVTVLGEVDQKEKYMNEFYRLLKPAGILSVSEQGGDPDKLEQQQIMNLAAKSGFTFYKCYGSKRNFTMNFKRMEANP